MYEMINVSRCQFLKTGAVVTGGLLLGFSKDFSVLRATN